MRKYFLVLVAAALIVLNQCKQNEQTAQNAANQFISKDVVDSTIDKLVGKFGEADKQRMERGVGQAAALWNNKDGSAKEFEEFCIKNFINENDLREKFFHRISDNFEVLNGHFNMINLGLKSALHLDIGPQYDFDLAFGSYDPSAHFIDDFFNNKIAFIVLLNFPYYTLKEKEDLGQKWTRNEWAYARLGDYFINRIPADAMLKTTAATSAAENYISNYNIYMGKLLDNEGKTHFPQEMKLISHWNLRDELKTNYNKGDEGLFRQKMIYEVMLHIVSQDIPDSVVNNPKFQWNPLNNKVYKDGKEITAAPEPDTRYEYLLDNFKAYREVDPFTPMTPTFIQRSFDVNMELRQEQVENLFSEFCSSPEVKQVAALIRKRLGRSLQPFDIWYDGFKSRSTLDPIMLDKATKAKYPNPEAFEKDIPNILVKVGFSYNEAKEIASHITVDPARGSGHAWGAQMKGDKAHLRSRFGKDGMDYKGYNIAVHELGHNVEQIISLYRVDNYLMAGVPNTAFTEAFAFTFQKHDLELLGIKDNNPDKEFLAAIDNFWMSYEIMGVSLVEMKVWQWLYEHPDATKEQLKETVITVAKEIWNKYYADVLGMKDTPILAIYSHMIEVPLYLSNYAVGHLIDFQLDRWFKGKNFGDEAIRIYSAGRLIPQLWMKNAVGSEISIRPLLEATDAALKVIK